MRRGARARSVPAFHQLARFGVVGVLSNLVYFGALPLFAVVFDTALWLAGAISYALSMTLNYILQRKLTFRSDRPHTQAGPRYIATQVLALAINSACLHLLVTRLGLHFLVGQGLALVATTSWNYLCQKAWVFTNHD